MTQTVPEILREGADTYEARNKLYGDNYKRHGAVMRALFPNGVQLRFADDHNRFGLLTQKVAKLTRYCENFSTGGHQDSLHDDMVYTAMLSEVDAECAEFLKNNNSSTGQDDSTYDPTKPLEVDWSAADQWLGTDAARGISEQGSSADADAEVQVEPESAALDEAPDDAPPAVIPEPPVQK